MNFVRHLLSPMLTVTLGLGIAAGCKTKGPEGSSNPPGDAEVANTDTEASSGDGEGGEAGGSEDPIPSEPAAPAKKCDPAIAKTPTPLFGESVLIRPPLNVELVEDNPTQASTYAPSGFVSACEATVDKMWLFVYQSDKQKPIKTYTEEVITGLLTSAGFKGGTRSKDFVDTATDMHTSVEYPAAGGQPAATLYIAVSRKFNNVLVTIYQTRPPEFSALRPTFQKSAESLLLMPPS